MALISDILDKEKHEERDRDGLTKAHPAFQKSGEEIIASVSETDPKFLEWREKWEPQLRFGETASEEEKEKLVRLLWVFSDIIAENPGAPAAVRGIQHIIELDATKYNGVPRRVRLRPHAPRERRAVAESVEKLLAGGMVRPSVSPWACGVVLVPKPDGTLRTCCDFRALNSVTKRDNIIIPRIEDVLDHLREAVVFSALDMASGYWAVPLREEDREKTAFSTWTHGTLEWCRMPMGLLNSGATYQRMLQEILGPLLWVSAQNYLDDVSIYSCDRDRHIDDLARVLKRLARWGIQMKISKCVFTSEEMTFFGFVVKAKEGVSVDPRKVDAIVKLKPPSNVTETRQFLGSVQFLRHYIPEFSSLTAPLRASIKGRKRRGHTVEDYWAEHPECQLAFDGLKAALVAAPTLAFPDFNRQFVICCDASKTPGALGAVLLQFDDEGKPRPIAYASRTLSGSEKNYGISDLECLAVVWATRKWRRMILGSEVLVTTDHVALKSLVSKPDLHGRLERFALELAEYDLKIMHAPGTDSIMALPDMMSRLGTEDWTVTEVQEKIRSLMVGRYDALKALLAEAQGEGREVRSEDIQRLFCAKDRELALQYITNAATPGDESEATILEMTSDFRARVLAGEALGLPPEGTGEYCHVAEIMERALEGNGAATVATVGSPEHFPCPVQSNLDPYPNPNPDHNPNADPNPNPNPDPRSRIDAQKLF